MILQFFISWGLKDVLLTLKFNQLQLFPQNHLKNPLEIEIFLFVVQLLLDEFNNFSDIINVTSI